MKIAPDFSSVETAPGERVVLTRSEKLALAALAERPHQVLTRSQLLDAISGQGSDRSDRNIDFLINRLRRKLSDNARDPRFIASRYGEGYVWIADTPAAEDDSHWDAYIVVGPLKGLENLGEKGALAESFAAHLHAALRSELDAGQKVVLAPDYAPPDNGAAPGPAISIAPKFFEDDGEVHCVATVRQSRSRRILAIGRVVLSETSRAANVRVATDLARSVLGELWRTLAGDINEGVPLPVLIYEASTHPLALDEHGALGDSDQRLGQLKAVHEKRIAGAWRENEIRLRQLLAQSPDDATLKVMYATHIHSKYVQLGYKLFQDGIDERRRGEDAIETLVFEALPHIQSEPEYAIMSAKLLHFLQRGYFELARELSEEAYAASTSIAGSLAMIGQFRSFAGETEAALRCLDQALGLLEPGTRPYLYALTIKLQALHATADYERFEEAKRVLYRASPPVMLVYEPLLPIPTSSRCGPRQ